MFCFTVLRFSLCKVPVMANSLRGQVCSFTRSCTGAGTHSWPYCSSLQMWTRGITSTVTEGIDEKSRSDAAKLSSCMLDPTEITRSKTVSARKKNVSGNAGVKLRSKLGTVDTEFDRSYVELAKQATILCFDIETTGFSRENDRIIEIAVQDIEGGEDRTFQSLVNPQRIVPNERIHGISTWMVNRPDVPRMKELIPVLLNVRSRQMPGGIVVLVAHNGRTFDVPFLKKEFSRCSYEIPADWYFADTIPLARQAMKITGKKASPRVSLQALREHYNIPLAGSAHRALSDVHSLTHVLQRLTHDLNLPTSDLIQRCFQ